MTLFQEKTYTCPICEEEVPGADLQSTNQVGQYTDFCPITMGFHAVPLVIQACRNCGYAGYAFDFEGRSFTPAEKLAFLDAKIPEGLIPLEARLETLEPDHEYYLACLTRRYFGAPAQELGDLLLKASWCLRLEGGRPNDDVAASRYRREAIREFECALRTKEGDDDRKREILYLLAELNRRQGDFERAETFFSAFLDDPPPEKEWTRAARVLLETSRAGDAADHTFEEVLGKT